MASKVHFRKRCENKKAKLRSGFGFMQGFPKRINAVNPNKRYENKKAKRSMSLGFMQGSLKRINAVNPKAFPKKKQNEV
jgi:hypothetical protein